MTALYFQPDLLDEQCVNVLLLDCFPDKSVKIIISKPFMQSGMVPCDAFIGLHASRTHPLAILRP